MREKLFSLFKFNYFLYEYLSKFSYCTIFFQADGLQAKETPLITREDLFSRSLILRFQTERRNFQGPRATLELRCRVIIGDLPPWERVVAPKLAPALTNQKLAQHQGKGINTLSH